jgi:hypothetical protein
VTAIKMASTRRTRFDRIEVVDEPERISSGMFHGYSRMLVNIPG